MAEAENSKAKEAQPQGGLARWTPSLPTNILDMLNPFSSDENNDRERQDSNCDNNMGAQQATKRNSIFSSFLPSNFNPLASAPTPPPAQDLQEDDETMFAEPDTRSNSDEGSREGSVDESPRRKSRRTNKQKTCYSLCHAAPASKPRRSLHFRPRSLMQLHLLSSDARPRPAFEVIPSANFSVRLTKAITKVFKAKHGLCPNDLVVLRAEKYSSEEQDEEQTASDIIALICKGRKEDGQATGKAKICLPAGMEWEAYPTLNGGYEFFSTDEHGLGLTTRWVPKRCKDGSKDEERKKFNFSTISPNSRRHPVIATLSKGELDINDTYKMPDRAAVTPLSTPQHASTFFSDNADEEADDANLCETDDRLRQLIVMTGIWVAFKEGWSPTLKYDDPTLQRSPSMPGSPAKASTFSLGSPPGSPTPQPLDKRSSVKSIGSGIMRRTSLMSKGNRASTYSVPEDEGETAPPQSPGMKTGRARADSASTVLVHRAASNRTKNHHQATWRPDMLQEMQESPASSREASRSASVIPPPTHEKRASVAQPILPPVHGVEPEQTDGAASGRVTPEKEKRESSATATTGTSMASDRPCKASAAAQPKKKKGGWRRLLCGSGEDV